MEPPLEGDPLMRGGMLWRSGRRNEMLGFFFATRALQALCCNRPLYSESPTEASVTLENGMSLGTLTYACVVTGGRAAWTGCNDALQSPTDTR